jgi:hypothetical protein
MTERTYKKDLEVISLVCCIAYHFTFSDEYKCFCHVHLNIKIVQRWQNL